MVDDREGEVRVLLDDNHRDPLFRAESADRPVDILRRAGREAQRRFVEKNQSRLGHDRARHREHLLFPAREGRRVRADALTQVREQVEAQLDVIRDAATVGAEVRPDLQVVAHREVAERATALGHVSDPEARDLVGARARDVFPVERDLAARGHHSADRTQGGRLARAVRTQDARGVVFADAQRDTVQHFGVAVGRGHLVELEQAHPSVTALPR